MPTLLWQKKVLKGDIGTVPLSTPNSASAVNIDELYFVKEYNKSIGGHATEIIDYFDTNKLN